jgi:signal transduction histidine kinase
MRQVAQRRIQAQVDRLSNMANELLEFTRSSSPRNTLVVSDYAEFLQPLIEDIGHEIATKSVRFIVPSELPHIRILLDGRRLAHVFYNLINNAVDAMPSGGQVFLRFRKEANQIITEIEDTGAGIAPEIADRLFEPFATFGKSHGTGLGLSICRRILEDHQGQIHVRNAPSGSAVFWFSLPISE